MFIILHILRWKWQCRLIPQTCLWGCIGSNSSLFVGCVSMLALGFCGIMLQWLLWRVGEVRGFARAPSPFLWSSAFPSYLSIFYPFLRHTISPFSVFLHLSCLLLSRSTLLGYFLWYTTVSLSFCLSVYLPVLSHFAPPSPLVKALILFACPLFPITQLIYLALVSLMCCNTIDYTPGGSHVHSLAQYVPVNATV